jgi:hypothetical protein
VNYFKGETGCNIFGKNNFSLSLNSTLPNKLKTHVSFQVYDTSFSKTVTCSWSQVDGNAICPCPSLIESLIELPRNFTFQVNLNDQTFLSTLNLQSKPLLTYSKPSNTIIYSFQREFYISTFWKGF